MSNEVRRGGPRALTANGGSHRVGGTTLAEAEEGIFAVFVLALLALQGFAVLPEELADEVTAVGNAQRHTCVCVCVSVSGSGCASDKVTRVDEGMTYSGSQPG
jgi:hypothetical protein